MKLLVFNQEDGQEFYVNAECLVAFKNSGDGAHSYIWVGGNPDGVHVIATAKDIYKTLAEVYGISLTGMTFSVGWKPEDQV